MAAVVLAALLFSIVSPGLGAGEAEQLANATSHRPPITTRGTAGQDQDHEYLQRMQRLQEQQHQHLCARCLCYGLRRGGRRVTLDEQLNEIGDDPPNARLTTRAAPVSPAGVPLQVLVVNCTERLPAQELLRWSWPAKLSVGEKVSEETWVEFRGGNLSGVNRLARLPFRLTNLSLANNALHAIAPRAFANLAQLRHLDLGHNHLKDVSFDVFAGLSALEWLDMSFNAIGSEKVNPLPADLLKGMDKLTVLNLRSNALGGDLNGNVLPWSGSLRVLDLSHNKFSSLSAGAWARLSKLNELDLSWNQLRSITPHAFQELTVLERLDLSHNPDLAVLPDGLLAGLDGLRALDLSHCPLGRHHLVEGRAEQAVKLPAGVQVLRLASCGLDEFLLRDWGGLHDLRVFDVSDNDLSVLSDIAHLDRLRELNVSHNGLARFPTVVLPELEVLDLSHNQLETPPALSAALSPRLRELNLDGNALEELHLGVPPSLRGLSVRGLPRLARLPQQAVFVAYEDGGVAGGVTAGSVNRTTGTACLNVAISQNQALSVVHEKAFEDLHLCQLDLSHNALTWLSPRLARWESLGAIDLQGNPWVCNCKLQWMLDTVVKQVYASRPDLLEDLRCAAPRALDTRRLVHWYNHTGSALCDPNGLAEEKMDIVVKNASVTFSVSTLAMVAIIGSAAGVVLMGVLGMLAHRRYVSRKRARNRRL